tara:strand:- start:18678 stop:19550 length:873 start_codon:yes stop_codon:yes gene_type:complete
LLNKLKIKSKLLLISLLPIISILILIATSQYELKQSDDGVGRIYDDRVVPLKDLKLIADDYAVFVINAVNKANAGLITGSEALNGIRKARKDVEEKWGEYMATTHTVEEAQLTKEVEARFIPANNSLDKLEASLSMLSSGYITGQLNDFDGPLYETIDPIGEKITELISLQLRVAGEERETIKEVYKTALIIMASLGVLSILVLALVSKLVYSSINTPLQALNKAMDTVASSSDLTVSADAAGNDELAAMSTSFNKMISHQRKLINDISGATQQLAAASEQMSAPKLQVI